MENDSLIIELTDVFVFEEKKKRNNKTKYKDMRSFSALSIRIDSEDTVYHCASDVIKAKNGDVCLVPQDTMYSRTSSKEKLIVFHFNVHNYIENRIKCFHVEDTDKYEKMFYSALEIWQEKSVGYRHEALSILYKILSELQKDGFLLSPFENKYLSFAADIIEKNFKSKDFKVEEIAKELYLSSASLRNLFKKQFDLSPKEYLIKRRIKEAEIMLKSKYFSQKQIAEKCGFSDVKYFRYAFKKATGKTIGEFIKSI